MHHHALGEVRSVSMACTVWGSSSRVSRWIKLSKGIGYARSAQAPCLGSLSSQLVAGDAQ